MNNPDLLPVWARIVRALDKPMTPAALRTLGFSTAEMLDAELAGHIKETRRGAIRYYESTFKGRRSVSIVATDRIIAYAKAAPPSVASPIGAPPTDPYKPAKWEPERPGATDAINIKSRGM